jgi:hypothetical protein
MAGVDAFLNESDASKKRRYKTLISILVGVLLLHIAAGVVAGVFIVAKYIFPPPANFVVKKDVRLPAKKREQKMNMAAVDAIAPKPSFSDKMQSTRPTAFALPDVPEMPLDQMLPLDPSQLVADQVASLSTSDSLGSASGAAATGGGGFGGPGTNFLGIQTQARRILILFDVSNTTIRKAREAGMPFSTIKDETRKLIEGLGINTRFGVCMFAQNYVFFDESLLPANDSNKAKATAWLDRYFKEESPMTQKIPDMVRGSPGFLEMLKSAFEKKPETIFIVSDGDFRSSGGKIDYKEIRNLLNVVQQASGSKPVDIHFVGANMDKEDLSGMRNIINTRGGRGRLKELGK